MGDLHVTTHTDNGFTSTDTDSTEPTSATVDDSLPGNTSAAGLDVSRCQWTSSRLPIHLECHATHVHVPSLGLGVRRNPRRAHLVVSPALAKHVAIKPHVAVDAATSLADKAVDLTGTPDVIIGFAETATGLARLVADRIAHHYPGVFYTHSTRIESGPSGWYFSEPHSHAATHRIALHDPARLTEAETIWLVDDEVTSGNTTANVIRELHARTNAKSVHVVCLVDARHQHDVGPLVDVAEETGLEVTMTALAQVAVTVEPDALDAAVELVDCTPSPVVSHTPRGVSAPTMRPVVVIDASEPDHLDRHGITLPDDGLDQLAIFLQRQIDHTLGRDSTQAATHAGAPAGTGLGDTSEAEESTTLDGCADDNHFAQFRAAAHQDAGSDVNNNGHGLTVHVVGVEEQIPAAIRCAEALERVGWAATVSTSTRSPALAVNDPGYPLRSVITWPGHDAPRFAYNIPPADVIVIIPEFAAGVPDAQVEAFRAAVPTSQVVTVAWR